MILLIDNYDSFSYNLYQMLGSIIPGITVIRNDEKSVAQICAMKPDGIVLSPGPGRPKQAGVCIPVIQQLAGRLPILGVCLGHQAVCEAFGGSVSYASQLMHGKTSRIHINTESLLFKGMDRKIQAARYHSLAVVGETLPDCLKVIAETEDGEIMAVEHREFPVFGVQFHPESILTPDGKQIAEHFLEAV